MVKASARKTAAAPPGVTGLARVGKDPATLVAQLQEGDVAVIDHVDLSSDTATAMVEAGVAAVLNAAPMISGRYANLGPEVLADAGVPMVDQLGAEAVGRIRDAAKVRVHDGTVYAVRPDGEADELAAGRVVDLERLRSQMAQARRVLLSRVDGLAQTTGEFLRREPELLLRGDGLPRLSTVVDGRPVVVVSEPDHSELQAVAGFVRAQGPVVVAVGRAADDLLGMGWVPDVVVVTAGEPASVPSADALRTARDVVLIATRGSSLVEQATIESIATGPPLLVDTSAGGEDVALLLAEHHGATLVVGVGLQVRLQTLLEGEQPVAASTFVTRLKLGERLVDAAAVRALHTGDAGRSQLLWVAAAGVVALLVALAGTPVGNGWAEGIVDYLQGLT